MLIIVSATMQEIISIIELIGRLQQSAISGFGLPVTGPTTQQA
jgi:hypothetical protein